MNHLFLVASAVADGAPQHTGPDFGKASPIGLLIVVVLLIATLLLLRSMNRQLKKVPESFDPNASRARPGRRRGHRRGRRGRRTRPGPGGRIGAGTGTRR